ncbi:hypothetical protein GGX14DRAFT_402032 [Mycena pura]|uniref:Uncharacterized protein n=1 Tax=Mycena pura TaxID=153505 RepID=A0AAD6UZS0_9AGAR|nr:hypothetical protein GGX14DRAFT_402032 [Mycena pura]
MSKADSGGGVFPSSQALSAKFGRLKLIMLMLGARAIDRREDLPFDDTRSAAARGSTVPPTTLLYRLEFVPFFGELLVLALFWVAWYHTSRAINRTFPSGIT